MFFTEALVLSQTAIGEADALFSLYTKDFGKIYGRAQGVKKEKAKLRGHLETLNIARIGFVETKKGERLIYAETIEVWPLIRNTIESLEVALYFVALADRVILPGERDMELWKYLFEQLRLVEDHGIQGDIYGAFEKGFLTRLGYDGTDDSSILGHPLPRPV